MKYKIIITAIFFFLFSNLSFAQSGKIRVEVFDKNTGEHLIGGIVENKSNKVGAQVDFNGFAEFKLPVGMQEISVGFIGYELFKQVVEIKTEGTLYLKVNLVPSKVDLKTIVISAGKHAQRIEEVPVSMEVLKPKYIENSNQTTMETAVEQIPGVTVIDGQANIRGGSGFSYGAGSRVLVLVDDLPLLAGDAGDVKWSFLPIENIGQVEVIKGASSALFGSSALNGVINMRTVIPTDTAQSNISLYSGIYDTPLDRTMKWWGSGPEMISGGQFSHRRKIGQLDLVVGGHYLNDQGYRQGESEERVRGNFSLKYHFKNVPGLTAGLSANSQISKGGNFLFWENDSSGALQPYGGTTGASSTLSLYTTTRTYVDPSLTYVGKNFSHKLRGRIYSTNNKNNTNQEATSLLSYGEYLGQYKWKDRLTISGGLSASKTKVSGDLYSNQNSTNYAAYMQADFKYNRWNLSAGYRYEGGEISGIKFNPQQLMRAGVNFEVSAGTYMRASYGQGFRFPTIAEKYIRTQVGSIVIYPNDSLTTERGTSYEFGLRQGFKIKSWLGFIDASIFRQEYNDMMEFTFGQWGNPAVDPLFGLGFKSKNIGNTRIDGFEISIGGDGKIGNVQETVMGGITCIDPIQTDFNPAEDTLVNSSKENVLKYRNRTMIKFDSETTYKKIAFGVSARYYSFMENIDKIFEGVIPGVKDYRDDNPNGEWVFDVRLAYKVNESVQLSFVTKNILNNLYVGRPADLQAPRTFTVQALIKL
jgi:iron complex outermembrane receptor protein